MQPAAARTDASPEAYAATTPDDVLRIGENECGWKEIDSDSIPRIAMASTLLSGSGSRDHLPHSFKLSVASPLHRLVLFQFVHSASVFLHTLPRADSSYPPVSTGRTNQYLRR